MNQETYSERGGVNAHYKQNQAVQIAILRIIPILEARKLRPREAKFTSPQLPSKKRQS